MLLIYLVLHIFHAVVLQIQVSFPTTAQSSFLLPHVPATYCSHHQGAIILQIHKQCIVFWMVVPCIWFEIRVNYQLDANICLF